MISSFNFYFFSTKNISDKFICLLKFSKTCQPTNRIFFLMDPCNHTLESYRCFILALYGKGVNAYRQIRRSVMKFCQLDNISTLHCIFDDAEILKIGQDFNSNCKQTRLNEIS